MTSRISLSCPRILLPLAAALLVLALALPAMALDMSSGMGALDTVSQAGKQADKLKGLYSQLMGFKDDPAFAAQGFAEGSEYGDWMNQVTGIEEAPTATPPEQEAAGELKDLGQEYQKTGGEENDTTSSLRSALDSFF